MRGEEVCRRLGNAVFYAVDLADAVQVVRVFEQIIADEKRVDVLINNAGIVNTDDFQDLALEQWNKILAADARNSTPLATSSGVAARCRLIAATGWLRRPRKRWKLKI